MIQNFQMVMIVVMMMMFEGPRQVRFASLEVTKRCPWEKGDQRVLRGGPIFLSVTIKPFFHITHAPETQNRDPMSLSSAYVTAGDHHLVDTCKVAILMRWW